MLNLSFAKLSATPTETSWSQVYNAGNLFACLSLSKSAEEEGITLSSIGKEMFAHLESEFFTLENKDLQAIKEAIANSTHTIPTNVIGGLCLTFFKDNILYLFTYGEGAIIIKREGKVGTLLMGDKNLEIRTASGFVENGDIIILQTSKFASDISEETLSQALELELPSDIAESLSPVMHTAPDVENADLGASAAIIIRYQGIAKQPQEENENINEEEFVPEILTEEITHTEIEDNLGSVEVVDQEESERVFVPKQANNDDFPTHSSPKLTLIQKLKLSLKSLYSKNKNKINLNHRNKFFLSIAAIILILLILSVFLTKKTQDDTKTEAAFHALYDPALKNYEDGVGIKNINSEFARSDFLKADTTLKEGQNKFKKGSKQEKQITELLVKVETELGGGSTASSKIEPKIITLSSTDLLSVEKNNSDGIAFSPDKDSIDYLTSSAVISVNKAGDKKDLFKNDKDWEKGVGLSTYQGNIYILDQKNGVLKFTAGGDGFGKSSYLKDKPDLSTASSIAIDGSVWILLKDGNILKYTKGTAEDFKVKGMDKPAKGASRLYTNIDIENLYILDPGNSRIIKINKEGAFQTQYVADILKNAKDLEVSEKDGKINVLSGKKIWEIHR